MKMLITIEREKATDENVCRVVSFVCNEQMHNCNLANSSIKIETGDFTEIEGCDDEATATILYKQIAAILDNR